MSESKRYVPKVKGFVTTIVLQTNTLLAFNYPCTDTYSAEKFFAELGKYQSEVNKKEDCDQCRLTLKWAGSCNAELQKVIPTMEKDGSHGVMFTFGFNQMEDLENFIKDLEVNLS